MKAFPKVDLHRHLEGSITPEILLDVAIKYGGDLPTYELERLRPLIQANNDPPGFKHFLGKFEIFRGFYPNQKAIEEIAYRAVKDAAEDNVKYLELRYSPTHFSCRGRFPESDVVEWINDEIERASRDFKIIVIPILTVSRDFEVELARNTVEEVTQLSRKFFFGLDIAGNEVSNSAEPFRDVFDLAKKSGLCLTVHAGEAGGACNVREAVSDFKADRIGHGIRAVDDMSVIDLLRKENVMLEVCLTSNIHTGVVSSMKEHPVKKLHEYGVPVCFNTDDPAISAISLTDEYVAAVNELGFCEQDLKTLNVRALDHAFYPDKDELKRTLSHHWEKI